MQADEVVCASSTLIEYDGYWILAAILPRFDGVMDADFDDRDVYLHLQSARLPGLVEIEAGRAGCLQKHQNGNEHLGHEIKL